MSSVECETWKTGKDALLDEAARGKETPDGSSCIVLSSLHALGERVVKVTLMNICVSSHEVITSVEKKTLKSLTLTFENFEVLNLNLSLMV